MQYGIEHHIGAFEHIITKFCSEKMLATPSDPHTGRKGEMQNKDRTKEERWLETLILMSSSCATVTKSVTLVMSRILLVYFYIPATISIEFYSVWSPFAFQVRQAVCGGETKNGVLKETKASVSPRL